MITGIAGWLSGTVTDDRYATLFAYTLVAAAVKLPWGFLTSADFSPLLGAMILRVPDSGGKWLAKTMSVAPADVTVSLRSSRRGE